MKREEVCFISVDEMTEVWDKVCALVCVCVTLCITVHVRAEKSVPAVR